MATVKKIPAVEARIHLGDIMKRSFQDGDRFIVEKSGIPMIAIINANEYLRFIQDREERFKILDQIKSKISALPQEEIDEDIRLAVKSIRKKNA